MADSVIRKSISFKQSELDYVIEQSEKYNNNFSKTLNKIILEHKELTQQVQELTKQVQQKDDMIKHSLTRIRLASNSSDKNAQIIIELLNSIIMHLDVIPFPTNIAKSNLLTIAEDDVSERIKKYRTKKLDKEFNK